LLPYLILLAYVGSTLLAHYRRLADLSAGLVRDSWGPVLPIYTPIAWLLCTLSLWKSRGLLRASLVSLGLVCVAFVLAIFIGGNLWGT